MVTGTPPSQTGIGGNYIIDPEPGEEVMTNSSRFLRNDTILAAASAADEYDRPSVVVHEQLGDHRAQLLVLEIAALLADPVAQQFSLARDDAFRAQVAARLPEPGLPHLRAQQPPRRRVARAASCRR